jgi:hypothetical protein
LPAPRQGAPGEPTDDQPLRQRWNLFLKGTKKGAVQSVCAHFRDGMADVAFFTDSDDD